jgi:hypothetical protein
MFLLLLFVLSAANDVIFVSVLLIPVTLPAAAGAAECPTAPFVLSTSST